MHDPVSRNQFVTQQTIDVPQAREFGLWYNEGENVESSWRSLDYFHRLRMIEEKDVPI
jgi:hypothetical protein